ncbi:MAG: alpha/beta hydrolase [Candidatus Pacebacteria bacterium]|nr:alpha/beta hydrolase [Candidatus Paceibacterota bacterium]
MKEKQQVVHIHGGMPAINHENYINMIGAWSYDPFKISNRWSKRYLDFLNENYEIIRPEMPNKDYANYQAWSIWFEKVIPYLRDNVILIGHSLGGGFLMKWLSINILPVSIKQLHLVAPTNNHNSEDYNLGDFINNEFPGNFSENNIPQIYIYHSEDDPEVPLQESESYHKQLQNSELIRFKNRGHFLDETFPELFANIKRTKG